MKTIILLALMSAPVTLMAQATTKPTPPPAPPVAAAAPKATTQAAPTPPPQVPPKPEEFKPKETIESLKLALDLANEKTIILEANALQASIEPRMAPLRKDYGDAQQEIIRLLEVVRQQNGWDQSVNPIQNADSPDFGKFMKYPAPPPAPSNAPAAAPAVPQAPKKK
jgi:hypothetical protein